jgi:hypothetical protein
VVAHPDDLGRGEAGQHRVGGLGDKSFQADGLRDVIALLLRALVAPQNRGAQRLAALVEQDQAVHLARKPDARNLVGRNLGRDFAQARAGRLSTSRSRAAPPTAAWE